MNIGNRVYLKRDCVDQELVERYRAVPLANIDDCMGRLAAMHPRIRLFSSPSVPMAGVALTVKARAGDNLMLHKALNMAVPGDVIVVSNEGENGRALMGEIMMVYLSEDRKAEGVVLDGPIRDVDEIGKMNFPVYATGVTPNGPYKEGPGEINVPISCGGVVVKPGDIVLGDSDGVLVIQRQEAEALLEKVEKYQRQDHAKLEAARNGTADRSWIDRALAEKGTLIIDDVCRE